MQDFWNNITGNEKEAFGGGFSLIPDGTVVAAEIGNASIQKDKDNVVFYEFIWVILDGEHKKRKVWQKVRCYDANQDRATKARNMLLLLYRLTNMHPPTGAPTDFDLAAFQGKILTITIREWHLEGRSGNFIGEVHGSSSAPVTIIESAFSRNSIPNATVLADEDLPF